MHMMDCARIEKGFRHFGHDITCEDHVLEAGLGFAVKTDKPDFIGRDAVLRKKEQGLAKRLVQFRLTDPEPLLYHNEPILRDGEIVGYLSSGAYGHTLGGAMGMGYVPCEGRNGGGCAGVELSDRRGGNALRGCKPRSSRCMTRAASAPRREWLHPATGSFAERLENPAAI